MLPYGAEDCEESLEDGKGNRLAALVFGVKGVAAADLGDIVVLRASCCPFEAGCEGLKAGDSTFRRVLPQLSLKSIFDCMPRTRTCCRCSVHCSYHD
jgi:hypothetical protein